MELSEIIKDLQELEITNKRRVWAPFMEKYHCDIICEVGVQQGLNFDLMIQHKPGLAIAVDLWNDDGVISRNDVGYSQKQLDDQYEIFKKRMEDKPFVRICRGYSFDVVREFPNNFFDMIYIDADHTYEGCLRDTRDWYKKIKPGGFLIGDDYFSHKNKKGVLFGVIEAVDTFTKENNLKHFILPRNGWGTIKPWELN